MVKTRVMPIVLALLVLSTQAMAAAPSGEFSADVKGALVSVSKVTADGSVRVVTTKTDVSGSTTLAFGDGSVSVADIVLADSEGNEIGTATFASAGKVSKGGAFSVRGTLTIVGTGLPAVQMPVAFTGVVVTSKRTGVTTLVGTLVGARSKPVCALAARVSGAPVPPPEEPAGE